MNRTQQNANWRKILTGWFTSPVLLICIPVCLLGMLLAWAAYSEIQASREIQNELRLVAEEGNPTTEAEIDNDFITKTSTEGTLAMNRIEMLSTTPMFSGRSFTIPYVAGDVKPLADLIPDVPWPEEPRVAEFLLHIQPFFNEIEQLEKAARPVWMPRTRTGNFYVSAYFAGQHDLDGVLRLAFDHAVYHRESERAMRVLRYMTVMTEATDWKLNARYDTYIDFKPNFYTMINRSLVSEIWSKSELQELHRQVAEPIDLAARWRRMTASSIVGYSRWIDERLEIESQSETLGNLRSLRNWKTLFDGSFQSVGQRIHKVLVPTDFDRSSEEPAQEDTESYPNRFLTSSNISDLFDLELLRRQTLVAIAIKEYHMENGHWPNQLSELEAFGLTADDWAPPGREEWKYEFDDSEARLSLVTKYKYAIRSTGRALKFREIIVIR